MQASQQATHLQQALHASNNEAVRRHEADGQLIQQNEQAARRHADKAESLQGEVDSQSSHIAALEQVGKPRR